MFIFRKLKIYIKNFYNKILFFKRIITRLIIAFKNKTVPYPSWQDLKESFIYICPWSLLYYEKNVLLFNGGEWGKILIQRLKLLKWMIPFTYIWMSIMDVYFTGGEDTLISMGNIEWDAVSFGEMDWFFEAGDWPANGSWDVYLLVPMGIAYVIASMLIPAIYKIIYHFMPLWWFLVHIPLFYFNDLFWEHIVVMNLEGFFLWWIVPGILGSFAFSLADWEFVEMEKHEMREDQEFVAAKKSMSKKEWYETGIYDFFFRSDEKQYMEYDYMEKLILTLGAQSPKFYWNFKGRWERAYLTRKIALQEHRFALQAYSFSYPIGTETTEEVTTRYFAEEDFAAFAAVTKERVIAELHAKDLGVKFDPKKIMTDEYEVLPTNIQVTDASTESWVKIYAYLQGPSSMYVRWYRNKVSSRFLKYKIFWLSYLTAPYNRWEGPHRWCPSVKITCSLHEPSFLITEINKGLNLSELRYFDIYPDHPETPSDVQLDFETRYKKYKKYLKFRRIYLFWKKKWIFWRRNPYYSKRFIGDVKWTVRRNHKYYIDLFMKKQEKL